MAQTSWVDPYLTREQESSVDGGTTSHGLLWHSVTPRWGHSMHPMCSYQGMFPARLVHYFIDRYTRHDEVILDPFSGRGTTLLQARVEGRRAIGNDLNPLAFVLTRAKAAPPSFATFLRYLDSLEHAFTRHPVPETDVPEDIRMLFHPHTLDQLVLLRNVLSRRSWSKWSTCDYLLAGSVSGILHGPARADGTSAYLSISMPNTFSMSPAYVRKYIDEKQLKPLRHSVFDRIRSKVARLYLDDPHGATAAAHRANATALLSGTRSGIPSSSVDLLLTSPPYLRVVNYGTSNWIRLWWLGLEDVSRNSGRGRSRLDAQLDHRHDYDDYRTFMAHVFAATERVLKPDGLAIFVIGDVAAPGREALPLALQLWEDVEGRCRLELIDVIEDAIPIHNKVSRIWGETRGQATEIERILILGKKRASPRKAVVEEVSWIEPYRDAGPDAAHEMLRKR